jgi:ectoine hydroxylase-related dioxygenase (phytanoyl-CoA dioxygenase family)
METAHATDIRDVTDEEVAAYREQGWAKLDGFVGAESVERLLAHFQERMGVDASAIVDTRSGTPGLKGRGVSALWQMYENPSKQDEWVRSWSHSAAIGRVGARLLGTPARWYNDQVVCKLPAARDGGPTPWHQDLSYHALDRRGRMSIWIALVDIPPEKGTMRFLTGSHMTPPLGRYVHRSDGVDTVSDHPWLLDRFEVSPPLHLRAGDATVHDSQLVHSAPENATDELRWVYSLTLIPHDTLYTGSANRLTDGIGLTVNQPFDHPDFPVLDSA